MTGSYDFTLVLASYCVAVIAAYSAIYFGTRLFTLHGSARQLWLWAGALCLGSGIWSMHFVGMGAYTMPMDMAMTFSAPLTVLSWVPAVAASALALAVITRPVVSTRSLLASAIIMGAGISAMHYGGMYAMQMDPPIQYDPLIVAISVLVGVVASGAALVICRQVRTVSARYALMTKLAAALVMGGAICGMHYTGMAAASYPMHGEMATSNTLHGAWMSVSTALAGCVFLLLALLVTLQDFRQLERENHQLYIREQAVMNTAFSDPVTGLGNRCYFERQLLARLAMSDPSAGFMVLCLEMTQYAALLEAEGEEAAGEFARAFALAMSAELVVADALTRYSSNQLMVIVPVLSRAAIARLVAGIRRRLQTHPHARVYGQWSLGQSEYPESASESERLIYKAQQPRYSLTYQPQAAIVPEPV